MRTMFASSSVNPKPELQIQRKDHRFMDLSHFLALWHCKLQRPKVVS